jgi:hypothetical protein
MTEADISLVRSSFNRCRDQLEFFEYFYERFIIASPEVAKKLSNTDIDHRAIMLRASLEMLIPGTIDEGGSDDYLAQAAALHSRQGVDIPSNFYAHWMDALMQAVREFDPQCDDQLEQAWCRVLDKGIRFITSRY